MVTTAMGTRPEGHSSRPLACLDQTLVGMYYDMDAAVLATFKVDDTQFSLTCDDSGRILASIELTRPLMSLEHLTRAFYRFWGQVCFAHSEIDRQLEDGAISFSFRTGDGQLDYRGVVSFRGEPIQKLLRQVRSRRRAPRRA